MKHYTSKNDISAHRTYHRRKVFVAEMERIREKYQDVLRIDYELKDRWYGFKGTFPVSE